MPVCVCVYAIVPVYACVCACSQLPIYEYVCGYLALTLGINSLQLISGCNIIHQPLIETTRRGSNSK